MYIKEDVDLKEFCNSNDGWIENEWCYGKEDAYYNEFISINKSTREITNHGYESLLQIWDCSGIIEHEKNTYKQKEKEHQHYIFKLNDILRLMLVNNSEKIPQPLNDECFQWWEKIRKEHEELDREIYSI